MPIYEYVCTACGFEKDYLQKMSEPALTECPSCHQPRLHKKISAPGFQLKGSGWYATDFKGGSVSSSQKQESDDGTAASTSTPSETTTSQSAGSDSGGSGHACGQGSCGVCA